MLVARVERDESKKIGIPDRIYFLFPRHGIQTHRRLAVDVFVLLIFLHLASLWQVWKTYFLAPANRESH